MLDSVIEISIKRYQWRDPAPKWNTYPDRGCHLASSCVDCPYRICFEDLPQGVKAKLNKQGLEAVKEFLLDG